LERAVVVKLDNTVVHTHPLVLVLSLPGVLVVGKDLSAWLLKRSSCYRDNFGIKGRFFVVAVLHENEDFREFWAVTSSIF
jgi:hypothetical protein